MRKPGSENQAVGCRHEKTHTFQLWEMSKLNLQRPDLSPTAKNTPRFKNSELQLSIFKMLAPIPQRNDSEDRASGRPLGCTKSLAEQMLLLENLEELDCLGRWLSNSLVSGIVTAYSKWVFPPEDF